MTTVVRTYDLDGQGCSPPATCEDPSRKRMKNLKHVPPRGKYLEYRVSKNCDPLLTARIPEWFELVHFWFRKPSKQIKSHSFGVGSQKVPLHTGQGTRTCAGGPAGKGFLGYPADAPKNGCFKSKDDPQRISVIRSYEQLIKRCRYFFDCFFNLRHFSLLFASFWSKNLYFAEFWS